MRHSVLHNFTKHKELMIKKTLIFLRQMIRQRDSIPNQELSGAKSELEGETVGLCSFYKWGDQPPYNSALRSLQMFLFVHI